MFRLCHGEKKSPKATGCIPSPGEGKGLGMGLKNRASRMQTKVYFQFAEVQPIFTGLCPYCPFLGHCSPPTQTGESEGVGVGVVVTPKPEAWQNCYSGLHFVCCPIRYSEKKTKTLLFVLLFTRLALLCRCAAKIGCGSEMQNNLRFF